MQSGTASLPRPRVSLSISRETTEPGWAVWDAVPDHRVRVHIGSPSKGHCQRQDFLYTPGDVDLIPAGWSDHCEQLDPSTGLMLRLAPALLRRAAEEMGRSANVGLAPRHQFRDARIEHIAHALEEDRRAGSPSGALYSESLGFALAVHLVGGYPAVVPGGRRLSRAELARLKAYVEAHLDGDLSLAALADVLGMSTSHLKALFRAATGIPVHEYVIQRRVARAKDLLLGTALPASQVALEAGFSHQSHMARCMRRILGVTPGALTRRERRTGSGEPPLS